MPKNPTAVLVEDQPELGHVIRDLLKVEGYDVVAVRTPNEAMALLREEQVKLLVTDLRDSPESLGALAALTGEFPGLSHIELVEESSDPVPFFGPWRVMGSRMTIKKPFRIDDLIRASRTLGERP